jgi:hypothetical protein
LFSVCKPTVRLFADDTIAYLTISNNNDAETLQKDLDKLGHWENEWCMKFHPDKFTVLRVTNKKKIIDAKYQLHGHTLEPVTSAICLFFYTDRWDFQVSTQKAKSFIYFAGNTIYVLVPL